MATKTLIAAAVAALSLSAAASAELRDTYIWHNDGRFQVKQMADGDGAQGCMLMRGAGTGRAFFVSYYQGNANTTHFGLTLIDTTTAWTSGKMQIAIGGRSWSANASVSAAYPSQLHVDYDTSQHQQWKSLFNAMAAGMTMTLSSAGDASGRGGFAYTVSLDGSAAALGKMASCVSSVEGGTVTPRGPARPYSAPEVRREIIL